MRVCMVTFLDMGLRYGGGIGEYFDGLENKKASYEAERTLWVQFFMFNMLFFVAINIILLNIIFGVIIDTFSALRAEQTTKLNDMMGVCFICALSRETLDRNSGFQFHIKEEHNMWQYLYYIVYLRAKDPSLYTGSDQFVMNIIEQEGIGWFPIRRALSVKEQGHEGGEDKESDAHDAPVSNKELLNTVYALMEEVRELRRQGKASGKAVAVAKSGQGGDQADDADG